MHTTRRWSRIVPRDSDPPVFYAQHVPTPEQPPRKPNVSLTVFGVFLIISSVLRVGDLDTTWDKVAMFGGFICGVGLLVEYPRELLRYRAYVRSHGPIKTDRPPWSW
jgi:hypothetical protein